MPLYEKFAPCNFARWANTDLWDGWEAAHILSGMEPPRDNDSTCAISAQPILDTITRAFMAGALRPAPVRGQIVFIPLEVIAWAKRKSLPIPNGLEEKVQAAAIAFVSNLELAKAAAKLKATSNDGAVSPPDQPLSSENYDLAQLASHPKEKRGVSKSEILAVDWPLPNEAPALEKILNKLPKWVGEACLKIGSAGKGSHLWNPAMLAICLSSRSRGKQWVCKQQALTKLIQSSFPEYLDEWTDLNDTQ